METTALRRFEVLRAKHKAEVAYKVFKYAMEEGAEMEIVVYLGSQFKEFQELHAHYLKQYRDSMRQIA